MEYLNTLCVQPNADLVGMHFLDTTLRSQLPITLGPRSHSSVTTAREITAPVVQLLSVVAHHPELDVLEATLLRLVPVACGRADARDNTQLHSVDDSGVEVMYTVQEYPNTVVVELNEALDGYCSRLADVTALVEVLTQGADYQEAHHQLFRSMRRMLRLDNTLTRALHKETPLHSLYAYRSEDPEWLVTNITMYPYPHWVSMFAHEEDTLSAAHGADFAQKLSDLSSPEVLYASIRGKECAVFPLNTVIDKGGAQLGRAACFSLTNGKIISGFVTPTFITSLITEGLLSSVDQIVTHKHTNMFMLLGGLKKAVYNQVLGDVSNGTQQPF